MLNWIVWNRSVYLYKNEFDIKKSHNGWYAIKANQTKIKERTFSKEPNIDRKGFQWRYKKMKIRVIGFTISIDSLDLISI